MQRLRTLHLFAGAGGGILADQLLGHQAVCAVEIDEYCQQVLAARQKDGLLPWFPIFADVAQFDGRPWAGLADVVSGGFPCQDISVAGKGAGIHGKESGLWREFARIICEVRPRYVFVENSPALTARGLGVVLRDLAAMGFNAEWGVLGAVHAGAPHRRERIWIVADSMRHGCQADHGREPVSDQDGKHSAQAARWDLQQQRPRRSTWWATEPKLDRVVDGLPHRVDRLRCLGNGQVPAVAALAWRVLSGPA